MLVAERSEGHWGQAGVGVLVGPDVGVAVGVGVGDGEGVGVFVGVLVGMGEGVIEEGRILIWPATVWF